jgi:hypothetical protein
MENEQVIDVGESLLWEDFTPLAAFGYWRRITSHGETPWKKVGGESMPLRR